MTLDGGGTEPVRGPCELVPVPGVVPGTPLPVLPGVVTETEAAAKLGVPGGIMVTFMFIPGTPGMLGITGGPPGGPAIPPIIPMPKGTIGAPGDMGV